MIEARDLRFAHDGSPVLLGISLDVRDGETLAVMGRNGAGKTTLLKLVADLREPDAGSIRRDGVVGFAPEDPAAGLFAATVAEEVAFFPRNRGLDAGRRAEEAMERLDVYDLRDRGPFTLSVGEQRRVAIAAVLAGEPDVLALDEPTAGLDRAATRRLAGHLAGLDATVVFSTHAADFAYRAADRVAVLDAGELSRVGPARDVLADEAFLAGAGIRPPGAVAWARERGFDRVPRDVDDAVAMLREDA